MIRNASALLLVCFLKAVSCASLIAQSYTTNVIDGISTNVAGDYIIGDSGPFNFLLITNAAVLSDQDGIIGNNAVSSYNLVTVAGAGSSWSNYYLIYVGASGSFNQLSIDSGGHAAAGIDIYVGTNRSSSNNVILIRGTNSSLDITSLMIGERGSGNQLIVTNGGQLHGGVNLYTGSYLGFDSGIQNEIVVTGAGSSWTGPVIEVGTHGSCNRLLVNDNARMTIAYLIVGHWVEATNNIARVSGQGTLLRVILWPLDIGILGSGNRFCLENGARMETPEGSLGTGSGAHQNTMLLTGLGTIWSNAGYLFIGHNGDSNGMRVARGALLETGPVNLGSNSIGNTISIIEGGASWCSSVSIGGGSNSAHNMLFIDGAGTTCSVSGEVVVGNAGSENSLTISNGATLALSGVMDGVLTVGKSSSSRSNLLVVDGKGSSLVMQNALEIGSSGADHLMILSDGAVVQSQSGLIGRNTGATANAAVVSGLGASWNVASNLFVGSNGWQSQLIVSHGGFVSAGVGYIGLRGNLVDADNACASWAGSNSVLVTDPGSCWENRNALYVGYGSRENTLIVSNGATVLAGRVSIGELSGRATTNTCLAFSNSNSLVVDGGSLLLTNGSSGGSLDVRYGTLILRDGLISHSQLSITNGPYGRLEFQGGILQICGATITNSQPLDIGDGFHGAQLVLEGGDNTIDVINIHPNSLARGWGRIAGGGVINNAGTLLCSDLEGSPLVVNGSLKELPGAVLTFELSQSEPPEELGHLIVGALQLDGCLRIRLLAGFVPKASDSFRLVSCSSRSGSFTNIAFGGRLKTTDSLGSFLVSTNGDYIELGSYESLDLDGDGVEDAWAVSHFGHSPLTLTEKLADADGDGASNYDEFIAGTDPLDSTSVFNVLLTYSGDAPTLRFGRVEGKTYRVWFSNDLQEWREVIDPTYSYPQARVGQWTDRCKDGRGPRLSRFYRMSVE